MAELNNLEVWASEIRNAYLEKWSSIRLIMGSYVWPIVA